MGENISLAVESEGERNKLPDSQMLIALAVKATNEEWIRDEQKIGQHKSDHTQKQSPTTMIPPAHPEHPLKFLQATVLMTKCLSGISTEHLLHLLSTKAPWIQLRWIFPLDLPTVWSVKTKQNCWEYEPYWKSIIEINEIFASIVEGIKSNVALTSTKPLTLQQLQDQKSIQNCLGPVLHSWQEHAWRHDELDCIEGEFNDPKSHQSRKKQRTYPCVLRLGIGLIFLILKNCNHPPFHFGSSLKTHG